MRLIITTTATIGLLGPLATAQDVTWPWTPWPRNKAAAPPAVDKPLDIFDCPKVVESVSAVPATCQTALSAFCTAK
jgi:hypothetical protein